MKSSNDNKMDNNNYHEKIKKDNIVKLRSIEASLPPFCRIYFNGMMERVSTRTLVGYGYDLTIFFHYVRTELFPEKNYTNKEITLAVLESISKLDLEAYLSYLSYYVGEDGKEHTNDARGKARKLSSLKSLYQYFTESEMIKYNPAALVHANKIPEKEIIRLEENEVAVLLDKIEYGELEESKHQRAYSDINRVRDLCIITLLLGTGMRVSECVGINLKDIDFDVNGIRITRKGGKETRVYFGDEVEGILRYYIKQRMEVIPYSGNEDALFLSMQKKRISVRAVQNLVKKYTSQVTSLKNITPHKLRSTFGTSLYKETGDIYLVATVLGHRDVNTTKKHYADTDEARKRKASNIVKLRDKP